MQHPQNRNALKAMKDKKHGIVSKDLKKFENDPSTKKVHILRSKLTV